MSFYDWNAREFFDQTYHVDMSELYAPFLRLVPKRGLILDAGCGSGRDAKFFSSQGFSVEAIDASSELAKLATEHSGVAVKVGTFRDVAPIPRFDAIWACASLLHSARSELPSDLLALTNALKIGGILYCSFKNGDFQGTRNDRFFNDLTEKLLIETVKASALPLKEIQIWKSVDARPNRSGEEWLNAMFRKAPDG